MTTAFPKNLDDFMTGARKAGPAPVLQQRVEAIQERGKEIKSFGGNTRKLSETMGRPSAKIKGIEYVKISPKVPRDLKKRVDIALASEALKDIEGRPIRTLDECVGHALEMLLHSR